MKQKKEKEPTIFVVYDDYGQYENCSSPIAAFTNETEAWEWIKQTSTGGEVSEVPLNPEIKKIIHRRNEEKNRFIPK